MAEQKDNWRPWARGLTGWEVMHCVKAGLDIALLPDGCTARSFPLVRTLIAEAVARLAAIPAQSRRTRRLCLFRPRMQR